MQWAGWWVAVVDGSDSPLADGPQRQVTVLAPLPAGPDLHGTVEQLAVAPQAEAPMRLVPLARALPGRGLEGDRSANGSGTFSGAAGTSPGTSSR